MDNLPRLPKFRNTRSLYETDINKRENFNMTNRFYFIFLAGCS